MSPSPQQDCPLRSTSGGPAPSRCAQSPCWEPVAAGQAAPLGRARILSTEAIRPPCLLVEPDSGKCINTAFLQDKRSHHQEC